MVFVDSRKTYLANVGLRFLQFVFAVTVIGLYGVDLDNARKAGVGADGRWVCLPLSLYLKVKLRACNVEL